MLPGILLIPTILQTITTPEHTFTAWVSAEVASAL